MEEKRIVIEASRIPEQWVDFQCVRYLAEIVKVVLKAQPVFRGRGGGRRWEFSVMKHLKDELSLIGAIAAIEALAQEDLKFEGVKVRIETA